MSLVTAVLGQAVPSFWLALVLIVVFGFLPGLLLDVTNPAVAQAMAAAFGG